jgi:hypothetical protein
MADEPKKERYEFFVDAKKYFDQRENITGADIKTIAGIDPTYQVFEEEEGDRPDKAISDQETVTLKGKIRHFYAVPPATFGYK